MPPVLPEACSHIFQAILEIETYVGALADPEIASDTMRLRAIERCIEVISEASRYIPDAERQSQPQIRWRAIAGIGNILRHDYYDVDTSLLLRLVRIELPPLKGAIELISPMALHQPSLHSPS